MNNNDFCLALIVNGTEILLMSASRKQGMDLFTRLSIKEIEQLSSHSTC